MTKTLHPQILQLKSKVAGTYCVSSYEKPLNLRIKSDGITTEGYLAVFGIKDLDGSIFMPGCFKNSIAQRGPSSIANDKIAFLFNHSVNQATGQFTELKEDDYGLYFRAKHNQEVQFQREKGIEINDGTINQFSFGFFHIWDKEVYDENERAIRIYEVDLREGTACIMFASNNRTMALRTTADKKILIDDLGQEAEAALAKFKKSEQIELRQILTRYKTLAEQEPEDVRTALEELKTLQTKSKPDVSLVEMGGYKLDTKQFIN